VKQLYDNNIVAIVDNPFVKYKITKIEMKIVNTKIIKPKIIKIIKSKKKT